MLTEYVASSLFVQGLWSTDPACTRFTYHIKYQQDLYFLKYLKLLPKLTKRTVQLSLNPSTSRTTRRRGGMVEDFVNAGSARVLLGDRTIYARDTAAGPDARSVGNRQECLVFYSAPGAVVATGILNETVNLQH